LDLESYTFLTLLLTLLDLSGSRYNRYVYTRVATVCLALVLSPFLADCDSAKDRGKCLWSRLWVVCRRCGLLRCHNYRTPPSVNYHTPPSVRQSSACRRSPSARPAHLMHI